eukprot:GHVS01017329.1.p1 GENE.GHVS01017329.1~~GHVS01017329.1.p1  ORF type:complete len:110 (+),score=21.31 GHVS01017329.1:2-331(+)
MILSTKPNLVLYVAGVDTHMNDKLGYLCMTSSGLYARDLYTFDMCASRGIPVAAVIGGGYSEDKEELSARHSIVVRAAKQVWQQRRLFQTFKPSTVSSSHSIQQATTTC